MKMSQNINHHILHVVFVSIILCGVQGHPYERSHQPTNQNTTASPNGQANSGVVEDNRSSDVRTTCPSDSHPCKLEPPKFDVPPVCKTISCYENPPFYPEEFIQAAIEKREDLKYLADVDTVSSIGHRVKRISPVDESMCDYQERIIYPKAASNEANEWRWIINTDNFTQVVRVEYCKQERSACGFPEIFVAGYEFFCKQKFVRRELIAVTAEGSIGTESFSLPASCCCHMKFIGEPALRLGIDLDKSHPQSPAP